ncbi:ABC transporter ATP-binding protein [Aurantibacillus circumpalustris]|uniref:ABC transporter ATP-binding protein n=1 Tax=Aurantibacillus circumpalustris TaxID=3036359 RepID=UPI00295B6A75|nr:ABC transporter ATP-binding protein [Aurantibacillus circumpalustris]
MQKQPLLEVKNLVTQFKTETEFVKAVNDVSFTLFKGETIGIVGESGSGKSVTSLSIMQLIPNPPGKITGGKIIYHCNDGQKINLVETKKDEMRKYRGNEIAMIFQEPMTSLNPVMKCGEQIMEAILLHQSLSKEAAREKTIALFNEVQLPTPELMFERYPHQLSGGQKQRVMIAMAISCEPKILIADEPTTALDVTVQKTILELLQKLQHQYQMGILFITHDLGVIAELADHVVVMYKGKIVEQGPVLELFSNPQHPYTKSLLACRPPLDFRVKRLPVVSDFMKRGENGEIIAIDNNVSEALKSATITKDERKADLKKLYSGKKLLELKNVKTWFPSKKTIFGKVLDYSKAVDDVTFDLYQGETLGLVGESGCGKTTLGRTILKLAEAVSGSILYKGKEVLKMPEVDFRQYRRNMQIIFQDPYSSLNPRITIGQAIEEPMKVHRIFKTARERKERVLELLKKVGLEEKHYNRYPHEFSGGQRQRICIARALGLDPEFIICDESVSALDVSVQAQVLNLLNELKQEFKFTYIFISHDLSVVKFMSDRMIVMQKGKIEEMGDPDEIYLNPKSDYTRKLIDSIPKGNIENIMEALKSRKNLNNLI